MKFQKPENFNKWTPEETYTKIVFVENEVKNYHRQMNKINSKINALCEEKRVLKSRIANKNKYINQLKEQLTDSDWEEI